MAGGATDNEVGAHRGSVVGWLRPWVLQPDKLRAEHRLGYLEVPQLWAKSHHLPETRSLHLGKKWVGIIVLYSFPIAAVAVL